MLFFACFWCMIDFRSISNAYCLFFCFPLLSSYSFAIPYSNVILLPFSSLPIQSASIFYKIGLFNFCIEQPSQTISCGIVSLVLQIKEFLYSYLCMSDSMIGSIFYFTTGLHGAHVFSGLLSFFFLLMSCVFISSHQSSIHTRNITWTNNFLAFHVTKIALLVIGFLGCIVWGHHTFMVGFDINTRAHYTSVTSIIAIPTGMKILNRLSSIWSGCTWFTTTLSWIIGFVYASSSGGSSGLVLANVILDVLPHDTYFVVSHSHHVSSLGAVYTIYAAFYNYWMILSSYFCFHDLIGRIHFMWFFISPNPIFFSMHSLGIFGFPRRIYDYPILFFKFHWFNTFGLIGVVLPVFLFVVGFLMFAKIKVTR